MISAWILKDLAVELAPLLTAIYQKPFDCGEVPEDWRSANITPVFKKGDRFKASNYRPVSLTSLCCKIQDHIITSNILKHLEDNSILTDCQHSFRARRRCKTQLLTLVHELEDSIDRGKQMDLVILDFNKAFDRVPHQRLLAKSTIMVYKVKPTSGLSPSCLTEANRSLSMELFQIKRQWLAVCSRELFLVPSCSCCSSMTYQIVSWPKQDCLQTTVSSTYLLRLQRTAFRYKKICIDWLSGKTNEGCVSSRKCSILRATRARSPVLHPYTLKGQILHTDEQQNTSELT